VIPALQLCLTLPSPGQYKGPAVIIVTTTVDQATQCHKRMSQLDAGMDMLIFPVIRNVGQPLGIRSALAAGAAGSSGLANDIAMIQRENVHILIGTPAKVNEVMTSRGGLGGSDCRLLIVGVHSPSVYSLT
jgi:translation initiation factor 4A